MSNEDYHKKMQVIESNVCKARGHVIHRVADLEMVINIFLAQHFGKDHERTMELLAHIFCTNRMTFDSKATVFCEIVKSNYPDFDKAHPNCRKDLEEIAESRNHFAHLQIDITEAGANKQGLIAFAKWNKGKLKFKDYTHQQVTDLINKIYDYADDIGELLK